MRPPPRSAGHAHHARRTLDGQLSRLCSQAPRSRRGVRCSATSLSSFAPAASLALRLCAIAQEALQIQANSRRKAAGTALLVADTAPDIPCPSAQNIAQCVWPAPGGLPGVRSQLRSVGDSGSAGDRTTGPDAGRLDIRPALDGSLRRRFSVGELIVAADVGPCL